MDTYINNLRQRNDAIIRACQSVDPDFVVDGEDQDQERWTVCYNYSDGLGWLPVDNFFNLYGTAWVSTEEKAKEVCAVLTMWKTEELFRGERPMSRQELIDEAIKVTKDTIMFCDDWTALDKLMAFVPTERLKEFLPVEEQAHNELKKHQTALKHWEKTFLEGGVDDEHSVFIAGVLAAERRNLERRIEPCNKEQDNEV